jgi:hypothetical protein
MRQLRFFYPDCTRRVVLLILTAFAVHHSAANEPVEESLRGGAGAPVREIPYVREQNNDRDDRYEKYADGLYVLPLFRTVSADRSYQVDVWNLLIGPGQETADFALPGTAILLVRAGSLIVVVDDSRETGLEMGGTLVVQPESRLRITNRATDRPINVRVTMFSGTE